MATPKKEQKAVMENVIVEGVIVSARYGSTKFDDRNKYRFSIKSDNIPYDEIVAYEGVGTKMTPAWYINQDGYINLASIYSIPVLDSEGIKTDTDKWFQCDNVIGSKVRVSIRQKEGAIYPVAIKVLEDGEERDPFKDL